MGWGGARRSRSAINSKVGGGLLWGEVGSLLILRIIDAFQHSFYNSIDDYLPTEPPPVQDFLLLEKSRQVMIGDGSLAFRNIGFPSTSSKGETPTAEAWLRYVM